MATHGRATSSCCAICARGEHRSGSVWKPAEPYSLDVALALSKARGEIQVSLVNPRRARRFAESLGQRSKTDPVDARVLCQYAERMPFASWQPSEEALRLRAITWTIDAYEHTAEKSAARLICQCRTASAARF